MTEQGTLNTDTIATVAILGLALGPPVVALVSMPREGRSWARLRIASYSTCTLLYGLNVLYHLLTGRFGAATVSGAIAFAGWTGATEAWRAWKQGDYRPARARERDPRPNERIAA